ncbi:MAG: dTMP kinase [Actinomycetota bacterium]
MSLGTPGRFVVLEGSDGSGKSTQAARLVRALAARGHDVQATFEPGATELGRSLRAVLLGPAAAPTPRAEALLMAADRAQHVDTVVRPALAAGRWVVSDRFVGSSLAYQGSARGLGVEAVAEVNAFATGGLEPDLVVYLSAPAEVLAGRRRGPADRIEGEGEAFLASVVDAYERLATSLGWAVVDARAGADDVERAVWAVVDRVLAP